VYAVKKSNVALLVAGALVAGLTLGGLGIASAATRASQQATVTYASGARMGATSPIVTISRLSGLSVRQIMKLRNQGESLSTIATDNGVDPAAVVTQTVAARQAHFDSLVAAGRMTAAQEQTVLDHMRAAVQAMMLAVPGSGRGMSADTTASIWATGMVGFDHRGSDARSGANMSVTAGQHMGNASNGDSAMLQDSGTTSASTGSSNSSGPGAGLMVSTSGMMGSLTGRP
jgi:hypothetical protein